MGQPSSPIAAGCQVRCACCKMVLTVIPGQTEFVCPTCQLPQMLPPELMRSNQAQHQPPAPSHGIDPTKIQLPCANCKAILNVPHGLSRFNCPQCQISLALDLSKISQVLPPPLRPTLPLPPPEEVNEVAIEVEQEEDEGGLAGETFTDYRPPKLSIGPPHPDPVVETSSLSAVQPPEPTYDIRIKDELERSKTLSCLQIETLVYACQRHLQHLPGGERAGFFLGDGAGVGKGRTIAGLIWENWHHGRRKALWISVGSDLKFDARRDLDDVGATCIEVHALNKLSYSKLDSKAVGIREGVVFSTYSSLIASSERGRSRLQQLVQWFGEMDGLSVFDECHKAKNLVPEAGGQPTKTGEAVLDIQARLPDARVIYCSATGASEPRNLGYMVRLGLWGPGTSFLNFRDFLGAMDKGGVGALELVAMDMKARGMYVCRTLSYKGVEFEVVEVPLEAKMMEMYEHAAEFWASLRMELITAITILGNEKSSSSQVWRLYWASHQRFFRHVCMSAKVPAVVRLSQQALLENKCVVIGLQSTGEARTEEAITKYGLELDDFISGPRELLLKFVEENYPLPDKPDEPLAEESVKELQRKRHSATPGVSFAGRVRKVAKQEVESEEESEWESETDTEPETESDDEFEICNICNLEGERKKLLQCSCCSQLVHPACLVPPIVEVISWDWSCYSCKEKTEESFRARQAYYEELLKRYEGALQRKLKFLEIIRSLDLPNNPLDDIVDQLGGPDKVAEITGRRGMLVRASGGKGVTYQARNTKDVTMEMVNMHEKQLFMSGKKLVAIISEAGSAGVSLQADRRAVNQRRRVHLTLELPWSADRAIQQFGRTHRSNQASAPEYRLLFTNLGGERRFASIVAKRLEYLGPKVIPLIAGPSLSAYNYDSAFGKKALMNLYKGLMELEPLAIVPPGCSSEKPETIEEFITEGRAALHSVGIIRDLVPGNEKGGGKVSGRIVDSDMNDVGRFLNRLLGLPPGIQNRLFELFVGILDLLIQRARIEGHLDSGIVDVKANTIELQGAPKTVHVDNMSGASTVLFTFTLDRGMTWEAASSLFEEKQKDDAGSSNSGFYESRREWMGKRHYLLAVEDFSSDSGVYKIFRPNLGESIREMTLTELKEKYRKLLALENAREGWEGEYGVSSKQCMHGPNCKLETTSDNQRIVGLLIPNAAVPTVLQDLAWVHEIDDE
ncbi:udp-glycosyltransferase [Salvia divinorum]|uniref:Udp-glycosyltransferase n=1 Tax=Salvia divinorum TaxID=28513 RepID=A0ABD1HUS8_SALDI